MVARALLGAVVALHLFLWEIMAMKTAEEYAAMAEGLLSEVDGNSFSTDAWANQMCARAQVYATLAVAAAQAEMLAWSKQEAITNTYEARMSEWNCSCSPGEHDDHAH